MRRSRQGANWIVFCRQPFLSVFAACAGAGCVFEGFLASYSGFGNSEAVCRSVSPRKGGTTGQGPQERFPPHLLTGLLDCMLQAPALKRDGHGDTLWRFCQQVCGAQRCLVAAFAPHPSPHPTPPPALEPPSLEGIAS